MLAGGVALKLKGLGVAPGPDRPAELPSSLPYDRWPGQTPDPHFGIRDDLEFTLLGGDAAPVGGLVLTNAIREFDCAAGLTAAQIPTVGPVAVLRYDGRFFRRAGNRSEPLGVSITASPVAGSERCGLLLPGLGNDPAAEREILRVAGALDIRQCDPTRVEDRLRLIGAVYRGFGVTLRAFSRAGWHRYSGHPDNLVVGDDGAVHLVDLDSCRRVMPGRDDLVALQGIRDGMSALYNLACSFFRSSVRDAVRDEQLVEHEPFSAFLDGWAPSGAGQHEALGRAIARYVIAARVQLRRFAPFLEMETPAASHLYRYVRHDRDLTFAWLYRIAFECRLADPAGMTVPFGLDALDERLLRFAGRPRFDALQALHCVEDPG